MLAPTMMLQQLLFWTVLAGIARSHLSAESGALRAQHRTHVLRKLINLDGTYLHSAFWWFILDDQKFLQRTVNLLHDGEGSNGLLKQDEAGLTLLRCCALSFSTQSRSDKWRLYPLCVLPMTFIWSVSFFWLFFLVYSFGSSSAHVLSLSSGHRCLKVLSALSQSNTLFMNVTLLPIF